MYTRKKGGLRKLVTLTYNFCFFSCPKSQVEGACFLIVLFTVNNSKFLQHKNKNKVENTINLVNYNVLRHCLKGWKCSSLCITFQANA